MSLHRVAVAGLLLAVGAPSLHGASCAIQGTPGATLLLPYFLVSRNGVQSGDAIPEGGTDTLVAIVNTGNVGLIVQATIWSKYGRPVLAWNLPMVGRDVAYFRMKDVLNGRLNVNPNTQRVSSPGDPCGINTSSGVYQPRTGFQPSRFIRFANPDASDSSHAISVYPVAAFSSEERLRLLDSLDESGDVTTLEAPGSNVLDTDNPACGLPSDGRLAGDLSGSMTFDVLNYCTTRFPDDPRRYENDALATSGWEEYGASPNVLMGDAFFVDGRETNGNISGDAMASLAFEPSLSWAARTTFYGRYAAPEAVPPPAVPQGFRFEGDGRLPLGFRYAVRYLNDPAQQLRSWLTLWRSGRTIAASSQEPQSDLCAWARDCVSGAPNGCRGYGTWAYRWKLYGNVYDDDANIFTAGTTPGDSYRSYSFLQSQRLDFRHSDLNPGGFKGGWVDLLFDDGGDPLSHQVFVSVQHSGPGLAFSVGNSATLLRSTASCGLLSPSAGAGRP